MPEKSLYQHCTYTHLGCRWADGMDPEPVMLAGAVQCAIPIKHGRRELEQKSGMPVFDGAVDIRIGCLSHSIFLGWGTGYCLQLILCEGAEKQVYYHTMVHRITKPAKQIFASPTTTCVLQQIVAGCAPARLVLCWTESHLSSATGNQRL